MPSEGSPSRMMKSPATKTACCSAWQMAPGSPGSASPLSTLSVLSTERQLNRQISSRSGCEISPRILCSSKERLSG